MYSEDSISIAFGGWRERASRLNRVPVASFIVVRHEGLKLIS